MAVLIGLIDQFIDDAAADSHSNHRDISWSTNKVGGTPAWIRSPSNNDVPSCKLCSKATSLVCQLYCPLGNSPYHRCLYIFTCLSKCSRERQGWAVLRGMLYDETYATAIPKTSKAVMNDIADDWLDDQDDWGQSSDDWGEESNCWGQDSDNSDGWNLDSPTDKDLKKKARDEMSSSNGISNQEQCVQVLPYDAISQKKASVIGSGDCGLGNCTVLSSPSTALGAGDKSSAEAVKGEVCDDYLVVGQSEALAQLHISSESEVKSSQPSGMTPFRVSDIEIGEAHPLGEEDRFNAVMRLLNTRHRQDSQSSTASGPPCETILKSYYLCVVDEPPAEKDATMSDHVAELMQRYEQEEGVKLNALGREISSSKSKGGEAYEKTELKHGDKTFHKFMKRLRRCPEQCIRYERAGNPLLIRDLSDSDSVQISPCSRCGGVRVFELQLLSPLIPWLHTVSDVPSPLEFGTVLIYTCEKNCWADDFDLVEEEIILQADPDQHLYR